MVLTHPGEDLNMALQRLNEYGLHEIPVVDSEEPSRVLAMLTRNNLGAAYSKRFQELRQNEAL